MKEEGIELLYALKGSKPFTIDLASLTRTGVIVGGPIEARKGNVTESIFPLKQILPVLAQMVSVGILARHPHDGDGIFPSRSLAADLPCLACSRCSCLKLFFRCRMCLWDKLRVCLSCRERTLRRFRACPDDRPIRGKGRHRLWRRLLAFQPLFLQETCQLTKSGMIVDTACFQVACVLFIERPYPFHANNRIQSHFHKRFLHIDSALFYVQGLR